MGFLDRLFGRDDEGAKPRPAEPRRGDDRGTPHSADEQALERYRYMLRTAPPDAIEQAHQEAFAQLTPEQRAQALRELAAAVPPGERAGDDDPRALARMATRAEMRQPGTLERAFGGGMGMGGGMGLGGMIGGSLLASIAGSFIGTAIAQQFFDNDLGFGGEGGSGSDRGGEDSPGYDDPTGGNEVLAEGDFADSTGDADLDFGGGDDFGGIQ